MTSRAHKTGEEHLLFGETAAGREYFVKLNARRAKKGWAPHPDTPADLRSASVATAQTAESAPPPKTTAQHYADLRSATDDPQELDQLQAAEQAGESPSVIAATIISQRAAVRTAGRLVAAARKTGRVCDMRTARAARRAVVARRLESQGRMMEARIVRSGSPTKFDDEINDGPPKRAA